MVSYLTSTRSKKREKVKRIDSVYPGSPDQGQVKGDLRDARRTDRELVQLGALWPETIQSIGKRLSYLSIDDQFTNTKTLTS